MKYIRTKDNRICKIISEAKEDFWKNYNIAMLVENNEGKFYLIKEELEGSTQAEAIEELCDEAVFFDKDNKPHYKSQEGNVWYLGASIFTDTLRFGIFTNKGLIYVAKMNDKGELELLWTKKLKEQEV